MLLNVFAYKNELLDCFTNPFFTDVDVEKMSVNVSRQIVIEKDKDKIAHLKFYFIGTFDDVTGKFSLLEEPKLLLCTDDIIGGKKDV